MVVSTRRPPPGVEDSKCKPRAIRSRRTVLPNEGTLQHVVDSLLGFIDLSLTFRSAFILK